MNPAPRRSIIKQEKQYQTNRINIKRITKQTALTFVVIRRTYLKKTIPLIIITAMLRSEDS